MRVNPGPDFESWNLDPSFWTSAGFGMYASFSETVALFFEAVAGGAGAEEVEEGKGIFVLVLGAAFNVTGFDGAFEEEEADDFKDLLTASKAR